MLLGNKLGFGIWTHALDGGNIMVAESRKREQRESTNFASFAQKVSPRNHVTVSAGDRPAVWLIPHPHCSFSSWFRPYQFILLFWNPAGKLSLTFIINKRHKYNMWIQHGKHGKALWQWVTKPDSVGDWIGSNERMKHTYIIPHDIGGHHFKKLFLNKSFSKT